MTVTSPSDITVTWSDCQFSKWRADGRSHCFNSQTEEVFFYRYLFGLTKWLEEWKRKISSIGIQKLWNGYAGQIIGLERLRESLLVVVNGILLSSPKPLHVKEICPEVKKYQKRREKCKDLQAWYTWPLKNRSSCTRT